MNARYHEQHLYSRKSPTRALQCQMSRIFMDIVSLSVQMFLMHPAVFLMVHGVCIPDHRRRIFARGEQTDARHLLTRSGE